MAVIEGCYDWEGLGGTLKGRGGHRKVTEGRGVWWRWERGSQGPGGWGGPHSPHRGPNTSGVGQSTRDPDPGMGTSTVPGGKLGWPVGERQTGELDLEENRRRGSGEES